MPVILGGNTGIYLASLAPAFDPDAQAFITAAAITDPTQQSAINQLVVDLKGYNIWSKIKACYPFIGGTSSTHKWNLKDPRDLDVAFRLVFNGGWTHSSTGALPNGTNAYADTKLYINNVLSLNSTHVSGYSRTNNARDAIFIGNTYGGNPAESSMWLRAFGNNTILRINTGTLSQVSNSDSRGLFIGNRNSSTQQSLFIRGTQTNFNVNSQSTLSHQFVNLAAAIGPPSQYYDNKEFAFASIGDGLTDTEAANFYTAVQAFQTSLGRQV